MLAQMQYLGVERALLQRGLMYGLIDEYIAEIVRRYPDTLRGCLAVDEGKVAEQAEIEHLRRCVHDLGLTALYFDNERFWASAQGAEFGAAPYVPFWEAVQALGIPVLWDIRFVQRRTLADYLGEVDAAASLRAAVPSDQKRPDPRPASPGASPMAASPTRWSPCSASRT